MKRALLMLPLALFLLMLVFLFRGLYLDNAVSYTHLTLPTTPYV